MSTWGIVSTILAPTPEILRYVAYHLELGASHIQIYLDDENITALNTLSHHPKVTAVICDAAHWARIRGKRPKTHQMRQTLNATDAYRAMADVDWLIHMDVDEFLVSQKPIGTILGDLPPEQLTTRIRPMEALAGGNVTYKAFVPPKGGQRARIVNEIYPTFGRYIKGGFLSHVAGKPFLRTGLPDITIKIHQAFQGPKALSHDEQNPDIDMAHRHAKTWEQWIAQYRYRLEKGSYRAELGPSQSRAKGGLSLHELFRIIEAEDGEAGLRAFYDEVCADTPRLRAALLRHGLLREVMLPLDTAMARHFPDASTV